MTDSELRNVCDAIVSSGFGFDAIRLITAGLDRKVRILTDEKNEAYATLKVIHRINREKDFSIEALTEDYDNE